MMVNFVFSNRIFSNIYFFLDTKLLQHIIDYNIV